MSLTILEGHVLDRLREMVAGSSPAVPTKPGWPRGERYFGLCNPPTPKPGPETRLRGWPKAPGHE